MFKTLHIEFTSLSLAFAEALVQNTNLLGNIIGALL